MGDYTGLRFRAKLTSKAEEALRAAMRDYPKSPYFGFWQLVKIRGIEVPNKFVTYSRSHFIPYGAVCYMPEDWGDTKYDIESGLWDVVCSAKDVGYHKKSMMELFCEEVLPLLIAEPCEAEVLFEEWKEPKIYKVTPKT